MRTSRASQRGFTLIELMIAVATVGILSSVALPSFAKYQLRSKQAERRTITQALHTAMNDMYLRDGKFPTILVGWPGGSMVSLPANPPGLPTSSKRVMSLSPALGDWSKMNLEIEGRVYYTYTGYGYINILGPGTRYQVVQAQGDLDADNVRPTQSTYYYYIADLVQPGYNPYVYDQAQSEPAYYGAF